MAIFYKKFFHKNEMVVQNSQKSSHKEKKDKEHFVNISTKIHGNFMIILKPNI